MHERDGAMHAVHGLQRRQRDGVVPAEQHDALFGPGQQACDPGPNLVDGLTDVERVGRDVAGIDHLRGGERRHVERRVIRLEQPGGLPDRGRAEPGTRPVGDAAVERHAHDRDVVVVDFVPLRQPRERRDARIPRHRPRVDLPDLARRRPYVRLARHLLPFRHALVLVDPPLHEITCPTTASSPKSASNSTAAAISSGEPMRPNGIDSA